jgi:diguanylate cyclase (GGDEF)-like protein
VRGIPPVMRFAAAVIAAGGAVLAGFAASGEFAVFADPPAALLVLAVLTVLAEHVTIRLPLQRDDVSFSPAQLFGFALLMMHGPGAAVAVWACAALLSDLLRRKPAVKLAFNVAQFTLSMAAAGAVLVLLSDLPAAGPTALHASDLPGVFAAGLTGWAVNHALAGIVSALAMGLSLRDWVAQQSPVLFLADGLLLAFSPVVMVVAGQDLALLPLIGIPFAALYVCAREAERRKRDGLHDALTGLPNRTFFAQRVQRALGAADGDAPPSVLLLDVDRFKEINDALGHAAGDLVLVHVACRLRGTVAEPDFVARLGGDEFAILRPRADAREDAALAARIRACLDERVLVGGVHLTAGASVGIATADGDGADDLIRRADVAMYLAKADGGVASYDHARDPYRPERLERMAELREGIPRGELVVHYQPKLSLATGRIEGAEALVRWQHPVHGLLGPGEFIPLAESSDLMEPLTLSVLTSSLDQAACWRRAGFELSVAVNVSAQTLLDRSLAAMIGGLLAERGLDGCALKLEITERTLMRDPARSAAVLEDLNALGIRVSIDDFGTGYSSLALLQRLPVDEIKIDRSFVRDIPDNHNDAAIVNSIVGLGCSLGVEVVAEGVETEAALAHLTELGCHTAQGYLISRPLPADALTAWLGERDVQRDILLGALAQE